MKTLKILQYVDFHRFALLLISAIQPLCVTVFIFLKAAVQAKPTSEPDVRPKEPQTKPKTQEDNSSAKSDKDKTVEEKIEEAMQPAFDELGGKSPPTLYCKH